MSPPRAELHRVMDCGGKRSATPLWAWAARRGHAPANEVACGQSGVAAALCHRTPKRGGCSRAYSAFRLPHSALP